MKPIDIKDIPVPEIVVESLRKQLEQNPSKHAAVVTVEEHQLLPHFREPCLVLPPIVGMNPVWYEKRIPPWQQCFLYFATHLVEVCPIDDEVHLVQVSPSIRRHSARWDQVFEAVIVKLSSEMH